MAETKTYKGKRNDYYTRHEARIDTYLAGPVGACGLEPHGMQNEPDNNREKDQFGREDRD